MVLNGTTLRVYRFLYRSGKPLGIHDIQRGLGLSSTSVADYHIKKLLSAQLIKEDPNSSGYFVDRVIFDNMVRIRSSLIPVQIGYVVFFAVALAVLLILFRPSVLDGAYFFSLTIIAIALVIFSVQSIRIIKRSGI